MSRLYKIVIIFFVLSASCQAHETRPGYLEIIQLDQDIYSVLWKVPAKGNQLKLSMNVVFDKDVEQVGRPAEFYSSGSYIRQWKIRCRQGLENTRIRVDGLQSTLIDVLVRVELRNGAVQIVRLLPEEPSFVVQSTPSVAQLAKTYTVLGVKHILAGMDHLLFLLCLLAIAGTIKRILITITGFTLAHSVTLVLSSLGLVQLSVAPVEAIIALSIVFVATELAKGRRDTLTWKYPVAVASSFGLLHGFGFAAVLNEIGLPQTDLVAGLLFFNVGVELGQLIFVVLVVSAVKLTKYYMSAPMGLFGQKGMAYSVGTLASYWLFERSAVFLF